MSRLRHSNSGFLRAIQISSTNLFVFVEGKQSDPYFYASICATATKPHVHYKIYTAQQLPGATGGKPALLKFFSFLRQRKVLLSSFGGQKTTCIFFLDKDIDDLKGTRKRSPHIVYTEHYDVQNYIFMHGDLLTGAASAASVDPARLSAELSDAPNWCLRVARLWKEWITLCLCASEEKISCKATYGKLSQVQTRHCGPCDIIRYDALRDDMEKKCTLPVQIFRQKLEGTTKKVDRYFVRKMHHRIFKGKWFANLLADCIDKLMAGNPYDSSRLANRLSGSVAATLDFNETWANHFRNPIDNVMGKL